jgi:peptidyl-dipeptidase Dcp
MTPPLSIVLALGLAAAAVQAKAAAPPPGSNPFFTASPLPFQAPPFDRIKDSDYQPALEEGMRRQLAEIQRIADDPEPPTFANTIEAMERSGELLTRVSKVYNSMLQANTSDALQKVDAVEAPRIAAHQDEISLNPKLFARVKAIHDRKDALGLDAEAKRLVERYYKNFVRAGAQLSAADQTKLRALNQEESKLTTQFRDRVLADTNASAVTVADKAELAGLPAEDLAAAAEQATSRHLAGQWVLALQNTTQQPALTWLRDRALRERLFKASTARGDHGGPNDTKAVVTRLAAIHAERAKLLGFSDFAAFTLDDQMAKTPQKAIAQMTDLVPASTAKARAEAARIQQVIDAEKGGFPAAAFDWQYYAEKVRKADYDMDESEVRQYFELDRVLHDGVFFAAGKLYGVTFKERKDIPVYQPDVRVFEAFDADGRSLALFYADYFARPSKSGGAWEDNFVEQNALAGTKAVVYNICNFQKPAAGQPALLSFTEVTTMFHEFGHALHGMFSHVRYPTIAGTQVSRDFGEVPSQFNEHWALEPAVFASYAKHYRTGAPMPQALVEKIKKAKTFNQGYLLTEYLAAALLDMAWHTLPAGAPAPDVDAFERAALARYKVDLREVPPRYRTTYFSHIWGGGYSAGYYAYLWSEVIEDDAYAWFKEHGGMTRANGQRFRDMILSRGGSIDEADMYRAWSGRDASVEPLLEERGLKPETP